MRTLLTFCSTLLLLNFPSFAQLGKPLPPGYIRWSATRRLQATDFQLSLRQHNNLATSVGNLGMEVNGNVYDLLGKKANQVVQNPFNTKGSYLDSTNQQGIDLQIRYLQTQWDIHEVAARCLRRELRANAKRMLLVGKPSMDDLIRVAYEKLNERQVQYADETKYGLFVDKQEAWEKQLATELAELAAFAIQD